MPAPLSWTDQSDRNRAVFGLVRGTAGRQIGGAFRRSMSIPDRNIGFWEIEA